MKKAIITGATSGIGEALTQYLSKDYYIYAIGRDFSKTNFNENVEKINLDLSHIDEIENKLSVIKELDLLINSAGFGKFEQHEDIKIKDIDKMIDVNLKAPLILSKLFLKQLKNSNGTIINITSIEAIKNSKFAGVYSATKAGLRAFGLSLYEEVRKSGVKVTTINPDITKTNFFDDLHFKYNENSDTHLLVDDIVECVEYILSARDGITIPEITLRSQKFMIDKKK